jgi:7,8-dihydropterin-6-yl-methyl-4-(beta-D-ribofuranosyl)aminobenzene 5'-phosphate synthase
MPERLRRVKITILADNLVSAGEGVLGEHGLSMLVQAEGRSLLFDVGQSGVFLRNAALLDVDLTSASKVVLSHGHYDHTGALLMFLSAFGPREVVAHPAIIEAKYSRRRGRTPRSIGVPFSADDLRLQGAVPRLDSSPQQLFPGAVTSGPIPRTNDFEAIPSSFAVGSPGRFRPDTFEDEQALFLTSRSGLVVVVGCSHRGVINTLHHALALTGEKRIHALIGGTHLGPAGDDQLAATIQEFRRLDLARIVACHCTGFTAAARLAAEFGDRFHPGGVGHTLEST